MKVAVCVTAFLAAAILAVSGQGLVFFSNNPYSFPDSIENGGAVDYKVCYPTGRYIDDPAWTVQLYEAKMPIGAPVHFWGPDWPGVWQEEMRVLNVPGGVTTTLEVYVYDGSGTLMGRIWPISYTPPTSPIARPDEYLMMGLVGCIVPEPSPVALGLLSLAGWGLIRRWRR